MFSYKLILLFVIIFLLSTFLFNIFFYVILIPCRYQVIVLVCNILVYFLFLQSIYVSLYNICQIYRKKMVEEYWMYDKLQEQYLDQSVQLSP